jgi:coenzyme PQQ precursor peptide PqqA
MEAYHYSEELDMKWETPQAIELRFGMEITMYVSHR